MHELQIDVVCATFFISIIIRHKSVKHRASERVWKMSFIATAVTDVGIEKKRNQDSLSLKIAYSPWGMVCMAVLCDGLGGLEQGEVASGNVVLAFNKWFEEEFLKADSEWTEEQIRNSWEKLIRYMNDKIKEYGLKKRIELGTTVTAVMFIKDRYYVMHIGDCRLYEINRTCRQITQDQTLIEKENILLQCVGVTNKLMPSFICQKTVPNASYLLCSDGFRHVITEKEIFDSCNPINNTLQKTMQDNLQNLVEINKQRGERDNISAILIRVGNV